MRVRHRRESVQHDHRGAVAGGLERGGPRGDEQEVGRGHHPVGLSRQHLDRKPGGAGGRRHSGHRDGAKRPAGRTAPAAGAPRSAAPRRAGRAGGAAPRRPGFPAGGRPASRPPPRAPSAPSRGPARAGRRAPDDRRTRRAPRPPGRGRPRTGRSPGPGSRPAPWRGPAPAPRPQLRGHEVHDGHAEPPRHAGQAQVELREVDQHEHAGAPVLKLAVGARGTPTRARGAGRAPRCPPRR